MASDKRRFELACLWHEQLVQDGCVSAPATLGKVAILSWHPRGDYKNDKVNKFERTDARTFRKEAFALEKLFRAVGKSAEIIFRPQYDDVAEVIKDPSFSDIVTIGNGSLSSYFLEGGTGKTIEFDWFDAISVTDHLKTGGFIQRHCGRHALDLNVPIGTFVTENPAYVYAPVGNNYYGRGLRHPDNFLFQQPLVGVPLEYDVFKDKFPRQHSCEE